MSKRVNQLLLAALVAASSFVGAAGHGSYLTILNGDADQRSVVSIKGMNDSAEDQSCSSIAMRLVYGKTWDSANLAQFFGPNAATSNVTTAKASASASDVALNYLTRVASSGAAGTMDDATITMNPVSTRMAVGLAYSQDLKNVMEGAWFDLGLSFARVENDLKAVIVGGAKDTTTDDLTALLKGTSFVVGDLDETAPRSTLNAGRILTTKNDSATGVEEVTMRLGYNFVTNDTGSMGGFISGVVGLGSEPKLDNVFESVVGHRHLQLGAGVQGTVSLSQTDEHSMSLNLDAKAHYIFSRDAVRMARLTGLEVLAGNTNYQQYYLTKDTTAAAAAAWLPAANALRQTVTVNPRYSAQLGAQFVYSNDCTSFDLGYNMEYRAKEDNKLVGSWSDTKYVVAGQTASGELPVATVGTSTAAAIKAANLNWNEDSKILHTVHGGVNYSFCDMANPMNLGLGGSVSIANDRQAGEGHWSVFAKLGLSF
jgi:hypothetical protein